jgi:uncharacterized protein (DUF779 family)
VTNVQGPHQPTLVLTDAARDVLERVRRLRGNDLVLVVGNGCCDSTAPFVFSGYMPGPLERQVGSVAGVPVFCDQLVAESFGDTEVVIDVRDDPQPDSFSCEAELGFRFSLDRLPTVSGTDRGQSS